MGQKYLIDSNAIIDLLDGALPPAGLQWLENIVDTSDYFLSVINRIEVLSTTAKPNTLAITEAFVAQSDIIPLEEAIVQATIALRRQVKIKLPDAVIASTALLYNLTVITRNIDDFKKIPGLNYINPYDVV